MLHAFVPCSQTRLYAHRLFTPQFGTRGNATRFGFIAQRGRGLTRTRTPCTRAVSPTPNGRSSFALPPTAPTVSRAYYRCAHGLRQAFAPHHACWVRTLPLRFVQFHLYHTPFSDVSRRSFCLLTLPFLPRTFTPLLRFPSSHMTFRCRLCSFPRTARLDLPFATTHHSGYFHGRYRVTTPFLFLFVCVFLWRCRLNVGSFTPGTCTYLPRAHWNSMLLSHTQHFAFKTFVCAYLRYAVVYFRS